MADSGLVWTLKTTLRNWGKGSGKRGVGEWGSGGAGGWKGRGGGWSHSAWMEDWGVGWLTRPQPCPGPSSRLKNRGGRSSHLWFLMLPPGLDKVWLQRRTMGLLFVVVEIISRWVVLGG